MEVEYKNGKKGIKKYCLKLGDSIAAFLKIVKCNQFKSKKDGK